MQYLLTCEVNRKCLLGFARQCRTVATIIFHSFHSWYKQKYCAWCVAPRAVTRPRGRIRHVRRIKVMKKGSWWSAGERLMDGDSVLLITGIGPHCPGQICKHEQTWQVDLMFSWCWAVAGNSSCMWIYTLHSHIHFGGRCNTKPAKVETKIYYGYTAKSRSPNEL